MDETLNRILSLLKERNIAKGKFLADLNFDRSALSEWVKGRHKSYMKRLPEIAAYFNVSLDWLAGIEQKEKPSAEAESLSNIEKEILRIYANLPEEKQKAFMTVVRALESQSVFTPNLAD